MTKEMTSMLRVRVSETWAEREKRERKRTSWTYRRRWGEGASLWVHRAILGIHSSTQTRTACGHSHTPPSLRLLISSSSGVVHCTARSAGLLLRIFRRLFWGPGRLVVASPTPDMNVHEQRWRCFRILALNPPNPWDFQTVSHARSTTLHGPARG